MEGLHLDLLGGFRLSQNGEPVSIPGRKDRLLLAFLALQEGRPTPRDRLAGLLWPDRGEEQARASLRQSLVGLRDVLGSGGQEMLVSTRETITLRSGPGISLDVAEFLRLSRDPRARVAALGVYTGPLLAGMEAPTPEFDSWLTPERRRLEDIAAALVDQAAREALSEDQASLVLTRSRELLLRDALREGLYQAAMRLLMRQGKTSDAARLYRDCCAALENELGLKPSAETTAVFRDIARGEADTGQAAGPPSHAALPERPVIAVMPFQNISGDSALAIICEGLAEDITSGLGAFRPLTVIDRYSASAVVQVTSDAREIGARLGADLVLQGSLQRAENGFRLGVRLVESETRSQRWAGQFHVLESDLLAAPGRIMAAILSSINAQVETSLLARSRRKTSLASYEHLLLGVKHLRGYQPDDNAKAIEHFDKALEADPDFALAVAYRGFADVVLHGYDATPPDILASAIRRIRAAADLEPDEPRIWWLLGIATAYTGDFAAEEKFIRRSADLNPNDANTLAALALVTVVRGRREEGLSLFEEAFRLNPFHPDWYWVDYGSILYACERYREAIEAFLHRQEPNVWVLSRLAACYAQLERLDEAREVVSRILSMKPDFRLSRQRTGSWGPQDTARFRAGMLKAGLPE